MKYHQLACLFLGLTAVGACRKENDSGASSQTIMVQGRANLWNLATASICFDEENSEVSYDIYMPKIKQPLEEQFNNKTIFKFVGIPKCSADPEANIRVQVKSIGRASAGAVGKGASAELTDIQKYLMHATTTPTNRLPVNLFVAQDTNWRNDPNGAADQEAHFYNMVVHEFGHVVGLWHEQMRADNARGHLCSVGNPGEVGNPPPGTLAMGPFDVFSIMNYCVEGYFTRKLSLSQNDIKSINAGYEKILHPASPQHPSGEASPDKAGEVNFDNFKKSKGCYLTSDYRPNFDGCADVLKRRAQLRKSAIANVSGDNIYKVALGCIAKYATQNQTCYGRVLKYIFEDWPQDNYACMGNGGGWGCIEPNPVPAPDVALETAKSQRIETSAADAATHNTPYTQTGSTRCFRDSVTSCLQGKGGGGCVVRDCQGSGDLLCTVAQKLYSCAVANGGTACFNASHGNCAQSNGGGSR